MGQRKPDPIRTRLADVLQDHNDEILRSWLGSRSEVGGLYLQIPAEKLLPKGRHYLDLAATGLRDRDLRPIFWAFKEDLDERMHDGMPGPELVREAKLLRAAVLEVAIRKATDVTERANFEAVTYDMFDQILSWLYSYSWELHLDQLTGLHEYRSMIQQLQEMVLLFDTKGACLMANPAATSTLGFPHDRLVGRQLTDLLSPAYSDIARQELARQLQGQRVKYEAEVIDAAGVALPVLVSGVPLQDGGRIIGILTTLIDLSAQKHLEDDVRRYEHHLAMVVRNSRDAIITLDSSGGITAWNRGAEEIFGHRVEEMLGQNFRGIVPADQRHLFAELSERVLKSGDAREVELQLLTQSGLRIDGSVNATAIPGVEGTIDGVSLIIRDISRRLQMERELRSSQQDLQRAYERLQSHNIALVEESERLKELLAIEPKREVGAPSTPPSDHGGLEGGAVYAMIGGTDAALDLARSLLDRGRHGLVISRAVPGRLRTRYRLEVTPVVWLTTNRSKEFHCIAPSAIAELSSLITSFIEKSDAGVVVLDGLEYLITQNSFKTVLNLIQLLNDRVMLTSSIIIVSLDPQTVDDRELHLLLREMRQQQDGGLNPRTTTIPEGGRDPRTPET